MLSERQRSIYMNAITQLHHPLMRKIKGIIETMYSLRPRSKLFQKKAIINLNAVGEISQFSMPREAAHRGLCFCVSGVTPSTPGGSESCHCHASVPQKSPAPRLAIIWAGNKGSAAADEQITTHQSASQNPNLLSSEKI